MNEMIRARIEQDENCLPPCPMGAALRAALEKLEELDATSANGTPGPYRNGYGDGVNECVWNVDQVVSEKLGVQA